MKKLLACLLVLCLISAMVCACGNSVEISNTNSSNDGATESESTTAAPAVGGDNGDISDPSNSGSPDNNGGSGNTADDNKPDGDNGASGSLEDYDDTVNAPSSWFPSTKE